MDKPVCVLNLTGSWNGAAQCLHPVLLLGESDMVLVDCGYPGSLERLEAELKEKYPALQILASETEAPYISGERKNLRLRQAEDMQERLPETRRWWKMARWRWQTRSSV